MLPRTVRRGVWAGMLLGAIVTWGVRGVCGEPGEEPLPPLGDVKKAVAEHFGGMPEYRPGDIITQSEVRPLLAELKRLGWTVSDGSEILGQVPSGGDFLVRQLRTPHGRKFMRQIGSEPDTYDRLQRISRMPRGRLTVSELIRRPGKGSDVIEYLATDKKGIQASKQMSRKVTGANFNKPTGRIYTVKLLLDRLEKSYRRDKELAAADK